MLPVNQLLPKVALMAAFTFSCFLLLVFLWSAFGGPVPLRAQGYRIEADFPSASTLAVEAEVRISGVPVGRVKKLVSSPNGRTRATIQLEPRYAPLPRDARALLRSKSIAGETYVELSPGNRGSGTIPDGGRLGFANVGRSVGLDEVVQTFDEPTRRAFGVWQQQLALTGKGRGRDISDSLAQLAPLEEQATELASVLDRNSRDFSALLRDTGVVFSAVSEREGQLRSLIASSNRVFATTAARDRQLAATFQALPAFERESRPTLDRAVRFAHNATPLVTDLRSFAREAQPTFREFGGLGRSLRVLAERLGPATRAAPAGLPAIDDIFGGLGDFFGALPPWLTQVTPFLGYVGAYRTDLSAFFANVTAVSQPAVNTGRGGGFQHYFRALVTLGPEQLALYRQRLSSVRTDPYPPPNTSVATGIPRASIETRHCTGAPWPSIADGPDVDPRATQYLRDRVFGDRSPTAPACLQRASPDGTLFPHVEPSPDPKIR